MHGPVQEDGPQARALRGVYVWAHELLRETRILVARPRAVTDLSVWKEPHEVARAVAARVLQRYGKAALVGRAREAAETWEARLESGTV